MPISVRCACGKTLQVDDQFAGRRIRCPACGQITSTATSTSIFEVVEVSASVATASIPRVRARMVDAVQSYDSRENRKPDRDEDETGYALTGRGSNGRRRSDRDDDDDEAPRPRRSRRNDGDDDPPERSSRRRSKRSSGGSGWKRVGYALGGVALVGLGIALMVAGWYGQGKGATKALVVGGCLVFCGFGSGFRGATGHFYIHTDSDNDWGDGGSDDGGGSWD